MYTVYYLITDSVHCTCMCLQNALSVQTWLVWISDCLICILDQLYLSEHWFATFMYTCILQKTLVSLGFYVNTVCTNLFDLSRSLSRSKSYLSTHILSLLTASQLVSYHNTSNFLCVGLVVLFEMLSDVSITTHNCTQSSNPAPCDQSTTNPPHHLRSSIVTWRLPSSVVLCNCIWTMGIHSVVAATLYVIISYRSTQN